MVVVGKEVGGPQGAKRQRRISSRDVAEQHSSLQQRFVAECLLVVAGVR